MEAYGRKLQGFVCETKIEGDCSSMIEEDQRGTIASTKGKNLQLGTYKRQDMETSFAGWLYDGDVWEIPLFEAG